MPADRWPGKNWCPDHPTVLQLLQHGEVDGCELVPSGSNYVFALQLRSDDGPGVAIYKPQRGEAPLWDYPSGTLYKRELAAYLVSEALGWGIVPPTVVRDGPHGIGSTQLYIEHDPRHTFFNLRESRVADLRRMAVFDAAVNNGDRKGGHCLLGLDGRLWGIDHGLTFHADFKLRTVIWDYAGESISEEELAALRQLQASIESRCVLVDRLSELISRQELGALRARLARLLGDGVLPQMGHRRSVPWPMI